MTTKTGFDPFKLAEKLRPRMIDLKNNKVLLASFADVSQGKDIPRERVMEDYFRIKIYEKREEIQKKYHNFRREPAAVAVEKLEKSFLKQSENRNELLMPPHISECNGVFIAQVNGCNLKCWQCYVDDVNKSANPRYGKFFSAEEILTAFLIESRKAQFSLNPERKINVLRLSGGDPFLVPEIILGLVESVIEFGIEDYIYVWIDTNLLSGDFYWKYLTEKQRKTIRDFNNIGFMGCYKGFDEESFVKTCGALPQFFIKQFIMHRRLLNEGLDVYSYWYPLIYSSDNLIERIANFMDMLQLEVDQYAPLRLTTPLTKIYSPTESRLTHERRDALRLFSQYDAMRIWYEELRKRFGFEADLLPHIIPAKEENKDEKR